MKLINGHTKQSVKDAILRYVPREGCIIEETCFYQAFDEDRCEARCAVGAFIPDGHKALKAIGTAQPKAAPSTNCGIDTQRLING